MPHTSCLLTVAAGLILAVTPAVADSSRPATGAASDTCRDAVNKLGASISETADKDHNGRDVYRFVLRTSGWDYVVQCDAKTGILGDVRPRIAPADVDAS